MDRQIEIITRKRIARDKLFAELERRLARIAATLETKTIIGCDSTPSVTPTDGRLEVLGQAKSNCTTGPLEDVVIPRRARRRKNPCGGTMGV